MGRGMARTKRKAAVKPKGPIQKMIDRQSAEIVAAPIITHETERNGDYAFEPLRVTTGELDGPGNFRVLKNRGGTTVQRWLNADQLSQAQAQAIALYCRAWHRVFSEPRVTANWSLVAFIRGVSPEERIVTQIEAEELLKLLDERIFAIAPPYYRDVWQNIILYDQPAGVAGGASRSSADRGKTICLFIADIIATMMRLG